MQQRDTPRERGSTISALAQRAQEFGASFENDLEYAAGNTYEAAVLVAPVSSSGQTSFDSQLNAEVEASLSSAEKILNEQLSQEKSVRLDISTAAATQAATLAASKLQSKVTSKPGEKEVRPYQFQRIQIKTKS
jgi:hypothetical protein